MANHQDVKNYLAYWLQLGKGVFLANREQPYCPQTVVQGSRFSDDFEQCWATIQTTAGKQCYLEGTSVTLDQLFSAEWEISSCARCGMAVPTPIVIYNGLLCPCTDLADWPNDDLPKPRMPQHDEPHLQRLVDRLSGE